MQHHARIHSFVLSFLILSCGTHAQLSNSIPIEPSTQIDPRSATVVDLDGDGLEDILVCAYDLVWYRNLGDGQFSRQRLITGMEGSMVTQVMMADCDGDGLKDVVFHSYTHDYFGWCRNLGSGQFGGPQLIPLNGHSTLSSWDLGDTDGDGRPDLVLVNDYSFVTLFNTSNGWEQMQHNVVGPGGFINVELADVDGDGDQDALIVQVLEPGLQIGIKVATNDGSGSFTVTQEVPVDPPLFMRVLAIDLDQDDALDIVAFAAPADSSVHHFMNDGTGTFTYAGAIPGLFTPYRLLAHDMDDDGRVDLIGSYRNISWHRNLGGGQFDPGIMLFDTPEHAQAGGIADLDQDGAVDIVTTSHIGNAVDWHRNNGSSEYTRNRLAHNLEGTAIAADLDGDGRPDHVVASSEELAWFRNAGDGYEERRTIIGGSFRNAYAADPDGDGDVDLVLVPTVMPPIISWVQNLGNGTFGGEQTIVTTEDEILPLRALLVTDINNDGAVDLVYALSIPAQVWVATGDGSGGYGTPQPLLDIGTTDPDIRSMQLADMDLDGINDLVLGFGSPSVSDRIRYHAGSSNGTFSPNGVVIANASSWHIPVIADMDVDGDLDVVHLGPSGGYMLSRNNADGTFASTMFAGSSMGGSTFTCTDLDNDGIPDIILGRNVLHNNGDGTFTESFVLPGLDEGTVLGSHSGLLLVDVDQDGRTDLIALNYAGPWVWRKNLSDHPNRATGTIFFDLDQDGERTIGEPGLPSYMLHSAPLEFLVLSDSSGGYVVHLSLGTSTIQVQGPGPFWTPTGPTMRTVELSEGSPISEGNDFGFHPTVDTSSVEVDMTLGSGPCGGEAAIWLSCHNSGTRIEQGELRLLLSPIHTFLSSDPEPSGEVDGMLHWRFDSLAPFQTRTIIILTTTPTVEHMGDTVVHQLSLLMEDPQGQPTDTLIWEKEQVVFCAYDPNDKQVQPRGYGASGAVPIDTDVLDYTIRFQNTGNAPAFHVTLRDRLASSLDRFRFEFVAASHNVTEIRIEPDGELVVRFQHIMLPDSGADLLGSQGFFRFRIGVVEGLPHLTSIENRAEIFFDLNDAVVTNTTLTTLVDCAQWQPNITEIGGTFLRAPFGHGYQWYLNGDALSADTLRELPIVLSGSYTVEVTSIHGCVSTSSPHTVTIASVPEVYALLLAALPNPFQQSTRVLCSRTLTAGHTAQLLDLHGRILRSWNDMNGRELVVEREGLGAGLYLLRILDPNGASGVLRLIME